MGFWRFGFLTSDATMRTPSLRTHGELVTWVREAKRGVAWAGRPTLLYPFFVHCFRFDPLSPSLPPPPPPPRRDGDRRHSPPSNHSFTISLLTEYLS